LKQLNQLYETTPYRLLAKTITRHIPGVEEKLVEYLVAEIPRRYGGDYGIPIMRLLRGVQDREEKINAIINDLKQSPVIRDAVYTRGYLNIDINEAELAKTLFNTVKAVGEEFGPPKTAKPERIVVEHTSANPTHPLHIGHARNMCLGDTLARMLRKRGHIVQTRFYINDMGRQVAVLVYGYMKASTKPPENTKPDHWLGLVYAITHTLIDLQEAKKKLKQARTHEEYQEAVNEIDKLMAALAKLRSKDPQLFDKLAEAIQQDPDPEKTISRIMQEYEYRLNPDTVKAFREVVELCLQGFRETMKRVDALPEEWDWESDLAWTSMVEKVIKEALRTPYITYKEGALALDLQKLLRDKPYLYEKLGIPRNLEIPPLVLRRSDGTTLYPTRDIAYTIKKFQAFNADKVINVIAAEQRLEQIQVRLALAAIGREKEAANTIHYAYEMVTIPGRSMSGRRGEYITLDEVIEAAIARARQEVDKRYPELTEEERQAIAEGVGIGAVRYSLVSVSATKPLTFNIDEAVNFERNTAPYIQYTYARAYNILRKHNAPIPWEEIDYTAAGERQDRRTLLLLAANYPYIYAKAADELKPEILVAYINKLADKFNKWYPTDHVIREQDPGKKAFKLALVYTIKTILENTLRTLGIPALKRL